MIAVDHIKPISSQMRNCGNKHLDDYDHQMDGKTGLKLCIT
jgi:hypothetical protein